MNVLVRLIPKPYCCYSDCFRCATGVFEQFVTKYRGKIELVENNGKVVGMKVPEELYDEYNKSL